MPRSDPVVKPSAHHIPDVKVQIGNKAVALQKGNKFSRLYDAPYGMVPSDQRFQSDNLSRQHIALGLGVEDKLPVVQGPLNLRQKHLVVLHLLFHSRVVPPCTV